MILKRPDANRVGPFLITKQMEGLSPRLQALIEYFAVAEPRQVNKLATRHGYPTPQSLEGTKGFLYQFILDNGDEGLKELMLFHPDREAISSADGIETILPESFTSQNLPEKAVKIVYKKDPDAVRATFLMGIIILLYLIING